MSVLIKAGGRRLLTIHGSLAGILTAVYSDYPWESSKFTRKAMLTREMRTKVGPRRTARQDRGYWMDVNNQKTFLEATAAKLGITDV